ncbi:Cell wall integrity and stress response component 4 [Clarireedia jacksonii]
MFLSQQRDHHRLLAAAVFFFALFQYVNGLDMQYCSSLNTAGTNGNSSIFQSDGLCYNFCVDSYAFAIVKGSDCWCSNYVPGSTTSTDDCKNSCPGYPSDTCGGDNTYGYISLRLSPSGTKGAATAAASSTTLQVTTSSSSPDAVTIYSTVTESPTPLLPSSSSLSTSIKSSSQTPSITSDPTTQNTVAAQVTTSADSGPSSTWTPTPIISLQTITGQVRTVTVTPTAPPNEQSNSTVSKKSSGLSTGGAVGLTVGLVALVAIIAGISFFCIRKRRQEKAEAYNAMNSRRESMAGLGGPIPSRTMSENSRYVLGTDGRRVVETWEPEVHTPGSRNSQLVPVDPRLDPFAPVYQRENKSRESFNTIRDDHDYSRRVHQQGPILRATNPDPD